MARMDDRDALANHRTCRENVTENEHPTDVLLYVDAVWQYSEGRPPDFRHESRGAGSNEIEAR